MFTACFDTSGTIHDKPYLIVGGYLATADDWISFDRKWMKRLPDGIAYFRRSECASNTGQFVGWEERGEEKDNLLRDLIQIINTTTVRKTACIIENAILRDKLSPEIEEQFHLHGYALANAWCISEFYKWRHQKQSSVRIEWLFEKGDDGAKELRRLMDIIGTSEPQFRGKVDSYDRKGNLVRGFLGLQAADFLAWELSRVMHGRPTKYVKLLDEKEGDPQFSSIRAMDEFNKLFASVTTDDEFAAKIKEHKPIRGHKKSTGV